MFNIFSMIKKRMQMQAESHFYRWFCLWRLKPWITKSSASWRLPTRAPGDACIEDKASGPLCITKCPVPNSYPSRPGTNDRFQELLYLLWPKASPNFNPFLLFLVLMPNQSTNQLNKPWGENTPWKESKEPSFSLNNMHSMIFPLGSTWLCITVPLKL